MSLIILNVDEVRRTLSTSGGAFVVHDKEVDIVRFAINSGFADIVLDGQVALRVMYQRPGETEVRAQTLTYYDTDGLHNYYDWQLSQSDLAKNGSLMVALCILDISGGEVSEWHTTPCAIRVLSTIHTDDSDEGDDTITPTVKERVAVLESMIQRVASGAPIVVSSTSEMTDTDQIYVLSTDEKWYYHNGTAWTAGGEYGAVSTDTTLTQSGMPADAKKTGDEITAIKADLDENISDLKSAFGKIEDNVESLENFTRKTVSHEYSAAVDVTTGQYTQATKILDVDIPVGQTYTVRLSTTATHGSIALYEQHADGTYKTLSYNMAVDTDLTYTAEKDTLYFNLLIQSGGFTSDGIFSITVGYTITNDNSLEERIDDLEIDVENAVSKPEMELLNLKNIPASANRIDETKYLHGKFINYAYGQVTDNANSALYYLDVNPGDTVYFWRFHNNFVIEGYSNSIGVFDQNGDFITRGGIGGNQNSYTVPTGVYKLGLNFSETPLQSGDKMMAIFNSASNPMEYIPFRNANNAYFSTNGFLSDIDFNAILPMSCKLPEDGFIKSYGHGGLSAYYPIDTALSIIGAKKAGMCGVELDIQITSDGVYVLYHDEDLRRVGGTQEQTIASMTYQQLQAFDFGAWFSPKFAGTKLCTLDKAAQLCRELGLDIWLDCKKVKSQAEILGANAILEKWGIADKAYWIVGSFVNIWTALPNAKVVFAAGGALTGGSKWTDPVIGWFGGFNSNFPDDKKAYKDGIPVVPDGVWFGVTQTYALMNQSYGLAGLIHESELAKERNIKYGFYAVDDVETIAELSENVPYQQYFASNAISYQNAMNAHYGITKADYIL